MPPNRKPYKNKSGRKGGYNRKWTPPTPPPAKPQKPHSKPRSMRTGNKNAGASARGQHWLLRGKMWGRVALMSFGVVVATVVVALAALALSDALVALAAAAAVAVVGGLYVRHVHRSQRFKANAWVHGAAGESKTAAELKRLGAGWFSFHDLAVAGSKANIDHLVIGPGGVYVVDTKNYRGRFEVRGSGLMHNGKSVTSRLNTTKWEASRAHDALKQALDTGIVVKPIWAVWGAEFAWGESSKVVNGVTLVKAGSLAEGLRSAPERLSPGEVTDLVALAKSQFSQASR